MRNNWYKSSRDEVIIFVPATPDSQLPLKNYQKEKKQEISRLKQAVKRAGITIKRLLQNSDPRKLLQYERKDCLLCRANGKGCGIDNM